MQKEINGDELLAGDVQYVVGRSTAGLTYLAYPSVAVPRFLIPTDDAAAQQFALRLLSADKGTIGVLMRAALALPGGLALLRAVIFRERVVVKP